MRDKLGCHRTPGLPRAWSASHPRSATLPRGREDEERLVEDMIELARQYGRYGYRRIRSPTSVMQAGKSMISAVERLWRREGLKVPYETTEARPPMASMTVHVFGYVPENM